MSILILTGMVASVTREEYIEANFSGLDPQLVGIELAKKLVEKGALDLLASDICYNRFTTYSFTALFQRAAKCLKS